MLYEGWEGEAERARLRLHVEYCIASVTSQQSTVPEVHRQQSLVIRDILRLELCSTDIRYYIRVMCISVVLWTGFFQYYG
jgi:hypothetical protein